MAAAFSVRRMRAGECAHLLALWERSVRATHDFLDVQDVASLKPMVAQELASPQIDWWVVDAAADSVPIGFMGSTAGSIEGLFIEPAWHLRGLGRALVAHAHRLHPGVLRVEVNEQNLGARRFYQRLGFQSVERSPCDSAGRPYAVLQMVRLMPPS